MCSTGLAPAGLSQKSLHEPGLGFEGDYSFKMRVMFLGEVGTAGSVSRQEGWWWSPLSMGLRQSARKPQKALLRTSRSSKPRWPKAVLAARQSFREQQATANTYAKLPKCLHKTAVVERKKHDSRD